MKAHPKMDQANKTGPLTILIPGTKWEGSGGWGLNNPLFCYGNGALSQNCGHDCTRLLKWSGGNKDRDRLEAADMLREIIAEHRFAADDKLNILAHSHGGNVALAASHRGLAHNIDNLITLNKPTLIGEAYRVGNNVGSFFNISAYRDRVQWAGSNAKLTGNWATDLNAVNLKVDTSSSNLKPHGALIWDDRIREGWWAWLMDQILIQPAS
jgi:hypothetical protein